MNKYLVVLCTVLLPGCGCTQSKSVEHTFSIALGIGQNTRQDLIFSPMRHQDISPMVLGLSYARKKNYEQEIRLDVAQFNAGVKAPFPYRIHEEQHTADPHSFTCFGLDYTLGKGVGKTTYVGGLFAADLQVLNYAYGRISSFGYFSAFGLGVYVKHAFCIGKNARITGQFKLPVLAWVARSPYLVNDDEFIENTSSHKGFRIFAAFVGDGAMTTLNKMQSAHFEGKYMYKIHRKWDLGAAYSCSLLHVVEPRPLLSFRNTLSLYIHFKF